jgi:hypothetical protein
MTRWCRPISRAWVFCAEAHCGALRVIERQALCASCCDSERRIRSMFSKRRTARPSAATFTGSASHNAR